MAVTMKGAQAQPAEPHQEPGLEPNRRYAGPERLPSAVWQVALREERPGRDRQEAVPAQRAAGLHARESHRE